MNKRTYEREKGKRLNREKKKKKKVYKTENRMYFVNENGSRSIPICTLHDWHIDMPMNCVCVLVDFS